MFWCIAMCIFTRGFLYQYWHHTEYKWYCLEGYSWTITQFWRKFMIFWWLLENIFILMNPNWVQFILCFSWIQFLIIKLACWFKIINLFIKMQYNYPSQSIESLRKQPYKLVFLKQFVKPLDICYVFEIFQGTSITPIYPVKMRKIYTIWKNILNTCDKLILTLELKYSAHSLIMDAWFLLKASLLFRELIFNSS